jgi:pyruvate formate lyase activating enzyme
MQAHVARIEPLSDRWPGTLSAAIFFAGCDYACPHCNASDCLHTPEEFLKDLKEIKAELRQQAGTIKGLLFTGGEPCIQRQALLSLAQYGKENNLKVGLETNGSKTDCIRSLISLKLLDYVALDLKSAFRDEDFERATRSSTFFRTSSSLLSDLRQTILLLKKHEDALDIDIRLTITPTILYKKEDVLSIAAEVEGLRASFVLQAFSPEGVSTKRLLDVKPPSQEFLQTLREAVLKEHPNMHVISG